MTYHLEPWVERILSFVVLIYPDGTEQEFQNGKAVTDKIFSEPYRITTIHAVGNKVEISLQFSNVPDTESFF